MLTKQSRFGFKKSQAASYIGNPVRIVSEDPKMPNCPRCRAQTAEGQPFCASCGLPLNAVPGVQATPSFGAARASTNRKIFAGAVAGLVIALIAYFASINLSAKASQLPSADLQTKASLPKPDLQVKKEAPTKKEMPQDVRDWLKHLERIEERKQQLTIKQIADMKVFEQMIGVLGPGIGELDPYDQSGKEGETPESTAKGKFEDLRPDWKQLIQDFRDVPPPAECKPLADAFDSGINEIPAMIGDLVDVMNSIGTNPSGALQKVQQMKNKSYAGVDRSFQEADGLLSQVCDKYDERKWFNIKTDVVGGSLLGKTSF